MSTSTAEIVTITGNTYPVKEHLKSLGGRWNADAKGWDVPASKGDEARKIVAGAASSPKSSSQSTYRGPKKCCVCGIVQRFNGRYPNVQIYKSGECRDCFEERKMGY
jgi:hypothetical protein